MRPDALQANPFVGYGGGEAAVAAEPSSVYTCSKEAGVKTEIAHPHVERRSGFRGGKPIIRGTNFPISAVVVYVLRHGMTPEEVVKVFPHLTLAQVYDALSYYYDHREEMDTLIAERVGEDAVTHSLPPGEVFLLRYDPQAKTFRIEPSSRAPSAPPGE